MSDFLVNLARRSVGLGSMIEVRTDPTAALPRLVDPAPAIGDDRGSAPPSSRERIVEVAGPPVAAPPIVALPDALPQVPAIAAMPAPVIQRLVAPQPPIAPTAAPPAPIVAHPSVAEPASAHLFTVPAAEPERTAAPPSSPAAVGVERASVPFRTVEYHVRSVAERTLAPAATDVDVAPRPADAAITAVDDIVPAVRPVHDAPAVEYTIAPRIAAAVTPVMTPPPPKDVALVRTEAGPPDRTIHVRIGTIEINGAEPSHAAAPAAPPPAVTPSPGFDDFTDLRSYAPWPR